MRGLEELGVSARAIDAQPPPPLEFVVRNAVAALRLHRARRSSVQETIRFARRIARVSPEIALSQSWAARARIRRAGTLDALVQIGTGYTLPPGPRVATFEDLTIKQAVALGYPEWKALSARALRSRMARQTRAYERAFTCCTTTAWAARSIIEDYGIAPEKVHAVGVGRNHDPSPPESRQWDQPSFLFVGKDWEGKNGPGLLHAFNRLKQDFPEARLDVVGNHPRIDGDGVRGHGSLPLGEPGSRDRIAALYQSATCFVLPSHYEASAISYVEAAAAGLPSIGTANGGSADLIGDAGRIVDPHDPDELYLAMRELADPAVAERLGALALRRSSLFTWRAVAKRLLRALELPGEFEDFL
jgi:glycosyltransferase involved in cell wall biosynthesis